MAEVGLGSSGGQRFALPVPGSSPGAGPAASGRALGEETPPGDTQGSGTAGKTPPGDTQLWLSPAQGVVPPPRCALSEAEHPPGVPGKKVYQVIFTLQLLLKI